MSARRGPGVFHHAVWITRIFRYALYAAVFLSLLWISARFAFVRIQAGDDSVVGVSGYRRLLVEKLSREDPAVERGDVVVFAIRDAANRRIHRISRVVALPGDRVDAVNGRYTVNGTPTEVRVWGKIRPGVTVPPGCYFVANDNPYADGADSRRLGFLPRSCLVGRFLTELPF